MDQALVPSSNSLKVSPQQAVDDIMQVRQTVKAIMEGVMIPGVHYGTLPGVPRPFLTKDGAEVLCQAFHLVPKEESVEDLSDDQEARYRVTLGLYSGQERVGFGMGICSSGEEKYKWKKASKEEYEAAASDQRRIEQRGAFTVNQIRTVRADTENTVLQQAIKRAYVQATRQRLAVSDLFHAIDVADMTDLEKAGLSIAAPRRVGTPQAKAPAKATPAPKPAAKPVTKVKEPLPPGVKVSTGEEPEWMKEDPPPGLPLPGNEPYGLSDEILDIELVSESEPAMPRFALEDWDAIKGKFHDKGVISAKQIGRLFGIARAVGWTEDEVREELTKGLRIDPEEICWGDAYNMIVALFETEK